MSNFSEIVVKGVNLEFKANHKKIIQSVNLEIKRGEAYVITGPSGSGKTTLAKIIGGELKPTFGQLTICEDLKTAMVSQQDGFIRASGLRTTYYGQRYEDPNHEGIPTVSDYLRKAVAIFHENLFNDLQYQPGIEDLLQRKLLSLSNGERKRVQLAVALLGSPDLLILDQPFVGLDVQAREKLAQLFRKLKSNGITFIIVSDPEHIPDFADIVVELNEGTITKKVSVEEYADSEEAKVESDVDDVFFNELVKKNDNYQFIVRMKNVNVSLGGKQILSGINWEVKPGEKWVLKGHNGAGKTTLLSLITADNPQGYTSDLVLFDRKRGSGESIWDIKKKLGFVSPELHLYFLRNKSIYNPAASAQISYNSLSCFDVILSGLKDEIGFNSSKSERSLRLAKQWLQLLKMEHLKNSPFLYSSLGEQRIILLARALIKLPELLILDEPCQGLDPAQTRRFIKLLDFINERGNTTMIYVTHRAEEIPMCITHCLELENGWIKSSGKYNDAVVSK
ncbi:MAG: ATP-binding cassette domain-containing protein [Prolixibacteraceae bacterium]|nr:ATP-binding cassette domain-containing protein [Prolixibacteraceae bacterium]